MKENQRKITWQESTYIKFIIQQFNIGWYVFSKPLLYDQDFTQGQI